MQDQNDNIRVVVFQDSGVWVAQCLEYDICAQAGDLDTLHGRLEVAVNAERAAREHLGEGSFSGLDKAPDRFFLMWERCSFKSSKEDQGLELALCA